MKIQMNLNTDRSENVQYDFPDYPAYIRNGLLSRYPNYTAPSHWHDDIELIAVLSGNMEYQINGQELTIHAGEGLFVNARQLHYGFSASQSECEFLCILLHPCLLCLTRQLEETYIEPLLSNPAFPFHLLHPDIPWEKQILDMIHTLYFHRSQTAPHLQIQGVFYQLWLLLFEHISQIAAPSPVRSEELSCMKQMLRYLETHYSQRLTLQDIAREGNICKSTCCTLFRRYLNRTPIDYLIHFRLQKSIDLLLSSDRNITEIALETGFSGTSYYIETFHRHLGCTPLTYRSRFR